MKNRNPLKKISAFILVGLMALSTVFITSCGEEDSEPLIPVITGFSPASGEPGDNVTISGTDLADATRVSIGTEEAIIVSNTASQIVATVPEDANTGKITVVTAGGTAVSQNDFEVIRIGAPMITSVSRVSAQSGENITISGTEMATVSEVLIGGTAATIVGTPTDDAVEITVGDSPLGLSTITVTNEGGSTTTSTDAIKFYVIEVFTAFNDTFDGQDTQFSSGGDAEINAWGVNNDLQLVPSDYSPAYLPSPIDGLFYHIEGTSDTNDSGSYTGQIGHSQQDPGSLASFFTPQSDVENYYYNIQVNWDGIPADYDDVLAGLRLRFRGGNYDTDGDGSFSDEQLEYLFTPTKLSDSGYEANEDGWFTVSIRFDKFTDNGITWASYDIDQMTDFSIASRRAHDGEYSMSVDNIFISKGGPLSYPE